MSVTRCSQGSQGFQGDYLKGLPLRCGTSRRFDGSEGERVCLFHPDDEVLWADINTTDLMSVWDEVSCSAFPIAGWSVVKSRALANGACGPVV